MIFMIVIMSGGILCFAEKIPTCPFYALLGKYCPACGNTRSLAALLNGDILLSMRYNLTVPFLFILGIAFYLERVLHFFGKKTKIVPRGNIFIFTVVAFFVLYYILRNFSTCAIALYRF